MISHALIFAAGRGERMRPLSDHTPKPLLQVGGKPLIAWQLEQLARAGVRHAVINTAHLADQFAQALGDGGRWGLRIHYSHEGDQALETGGGMRMALPYLGERPFIAVNGDVFSDFDHARLPDEPDGLAHLVMVPNPPYHPSGDFALDDGRLIEDGERLTFAGIGVYRPQLVADCPVGRFALAPLLVDAIRAGQVSGERFDGRWHNIGTPQQLATLDKELGGGSTPQD